MASFATRMFTACAIIAALTIPGSVVRGQQANIQVLRIGNTGSLSPVGGNESEALKSLQSFIKDQTGFDNEIVRQKDWQELTQKMAQKQLHLGAFQGYEFAWAQEKDPHLKPLALGINVYAYPMVYVVTRNDSPATDIGGLQGQTIALPATGQAYLRLFLAKLTHDLGKKPEEFFSKITAPENVEDALDGVIDGTVQAAVADRAAFDGYRTRKPGRFNRLKQLARSQPLPPSVVAYYEGVLDSGTLDRFRQGLLNASNSDRGQTLLTLFRLTGFVAPPDDFDKVLADTRKTYAPSLLSK
jgi:ABC-type phosphate/phosphonate transport system substrate-binding protein